jgi:dihydrofolate reductase
LGKVIAGGSVSLDGFITGPDAASTNLLFAWLHGGEVEYPSVLPDVTFRFAQPDYDWFAELNDHAGALVMGRRIFDDFDGWGGRHPFDQNVVVVTHSVPEAWVAAHPDAKFTFVTDGVAAAFERAREIAGDRNVTVGAGTMTTQALELGLVDELWIDLVPVLLGSGARFFDGLRNAPILLDGPDRIVEGAGVTHLRYQVRRVGYSEGS